jgi:hypothetical protein
LNLCGCIVDTPNCWKRHIPQSQKLHQTDDSAAHPLCPDCNYGPHSQNVSG